MQNNIVFQNILFTSSDTTTSTKQDHHTFFQMPFLLSGSTGFSFSQRPLSTQSLWTNSQKENYSIFVCYFRHILKKLTIDQLNWSVFKGMSKFIKSRNPQQCRSHHIKLIKEFDGIGNFLSHTVKRICHLQQKMFQAEKGLIDIQQQYGLYENGTKQNQKVQLSIKLNSSKQVLNQVNYNYMNHEKTQKQDLIKTADSYNEDQNPVKNNFFFSSLSETNEIINIKPRVSRGSLPSFENHQDEEKKSMKKIKSSENNLIEEINLQQINKKVGSIKIIKEQNKFQSQKIKLTKLRFSQINEYYQNYNSLENQDQQAIKNTVEINETNNSLLK